MSAMAGDAVAVVTAASHGEFGVAEMLIALADDHYEIAVELMQIATAALGALADSQGVSVASLLQTCGLWAVQQEATS